MFNNKNNIYTTINCMIKQTILPVRWVIVNDGSSDNTEQIIIDFMKKLWMGCSRSSGEETLEMDHSHP